MHHYRTMVQLSNIRSHSDPKKRAGRVQRRHASRQVDILRAAAQELRKRGFSATGMREIAAAADLSPSNLYHYFKGKEDLIYFCQDRSLDLMLKALRTARRFRKTNSERLRTVIETHIHCVLDGIQGAVAHLEMESLPASLRQRLVPKRDLYENQIRRLVSKGIDSNEFVPCDAKLATRAILGAINSTIRWYRPEGSMSASDIAEQMSRFLVRGLLVNPDNGNSVSAITTGEKCFDTNS